MAHVNKIIKLLDGLDALNFKLYGSKRSFMSVTIYGDNSGHFSYGEEKTEASFSNLKEAVDMLKDIYLEVRERCDIEGVL